jgi:hypothetical protein
MPPVSEVPDNIQLLISEKMEGQLEKILRIVKEMLAERDKHIEDLTLEIKGVSEKINASNIMQARATGALIFMKYAVGVSAGVVTIGVGIITALQFIKH